jgi:hypothetical protein
MPDNDRDQYDDNRPRFWRAIDALQKEEILTKEKIRVLEDSFNKHLDYHDGMAKTLEAIKEKLEVNGNILVAVKINQEANKKEIDSLWAFPLKIAGFIVAAGGAGTVAYKLAHWFISAGDVRIVTK